MNTYTKEEYLKIYPSGVLFYPDPEIPFPYKWRHYKIEYSYKRTYCSCRRSFGFYENCPNCLGYGVPPIPPEEVL